MNFSQVEKELISEGRKRRQAHTFATAQSQHRYLAMLNGTDRAETATRDCLEHMLSQEDKEISTLIRSSYLEEVH